jgi:hypothetical protein
MSVFQGLGTPVALATLVLILAAMLWLLIGALRGRR